MRKRSPRQRRPHPRLAGQCVTNSVYERLYEEAQAGLSNLGERPLKGFGRVQMWGLKTPEEK